MTIHEALKNFLSSRLPAVTGGVFEVSVPFDSRDQTFRMTTPVMTFELVNYAEKPIGGGVFYTILDFNILAGNGAAIDGIISDVTALFEDSIYIDAFEIALSVSEVKDVFDASIQCRRIWMELKGVIIEDMGSHESISL